MGKNFNKYLEKTKEKVKQGKNIKTCKCGAPAGRIAPCPYDADINNKTVLCNCCDNCRDECRADI